MPKNPALPQPAVTAQRAVAPQLAVASQYPLGAALEFLQRLWELNHALEKLSGQMDKTLGVTAPQRLIVRCLGKYPGLSASQLAGLLHLDPGTISAALKRLESKQLVERRKDPRDKRRAALGLTKKGRLLDHATPGTVEDAVDRVLKASSELDVEAAARVLSSLTAQLVGELKT